MVVRTQQAWNESFVLRRLSQLRSALGHYGARTIRNRLNAFREHLIACAKAASIARCDYQQVTPAREITVRDPKTGQSHTLRTDGRTGDPCGGRLKDRRQRINGTLVVDQVCLACGRVA
jgi:hypothetical protein